MGYYLWRLGRVTWTELRTTITYNEADLMVLLLEAERDMMIRLKNKHAGR